MYSEIIKILDDHKEKMVTNANWYVNQKVETYEGYIRRHGGPGEILYQEAFTAISFAGYLGLLDPVEQDDYYRRIGSSVVTRRV